MDGLLNGYAMRKGLFYQYVVFVVSSTASSCCLILFSIGSLLILGCFWVWVFRFRLSSRWALFELIMVALSLHQSTIWGICLLDSCVMIVFTSSIVSSFQFLGWFGVFFGGLRVCEGCLTDLSVEYGGPTTFASGS